jgi:5'(3')-deoxyribonucleotidase
MMRILLDQDEVICQWTARILEWYNQDHKTNFSCDDVRDNWYLESLLGPEANHFIRSCMRWPEFYTRLDPVPGAIEGVKALLDRGHEVRIVTAVPVSAGIAYHGKCQWVRDHMPFFNLKHLYAVHQKAEVEGDILLDDGPHNIEAWEKAGKVGCYFTTRANTGKPSAHRVSTWPEFIQLIDRLSAEKK